jgi:gas vesicle protein
MTYINCLEQGKKLNKLAQGVMHASSEFMALADVGTSKDLIVLELQSVEPRPGAAKIALPKRMIEVSLVKGQTLYSVFEVSCTPKGFWRYQHVRDLRSAQSAEGFRDLVYDVLKSDLPEEDKNLAVVYLGNKASAQTTKALQEHMNILAKQVGEDLNYVKKDLTDALDALGKEVEGGVKQVKKSAKEITDEATKWIDVAQALLGTKKQQDSN